MPLGFGMPEAGFVVVTALLGLAGTGAGSGAGSPLDVPGCSKGRVILELGISRDFALPGADIGRDLRLGDMYNFESLGTERGTLNFAAFTRFGRLC